MDNFWDFNSFCCSFIEMSGTAEKEKEKSNVWRAFGICPFVLFCKAEGKIMPTIRLLRNIQTFYIKWIFDSLFNQVYDGTIFMGLALFLA